tara:strand:- start:47 stop:1396 length:1350 start_codon:yes stop_codon:yes gene_type:complete
MRVFLLLFLFQSFLYCQKLDSSNFLILEGESPNYYYVLTEDGYYISENSDNFTFKKYTKPLPKSLNIGLNTLLPVTHKSKSYLLYPGGGLLYLFSNGSISRIDRSFPHRNQYGGYFFSYKDNLFLIGGYGYWQTKSIVTKFNFNSGDWEIVTAFGQSPDGIDQGTFFVKNNTLYVFDFFTRTSNNQKEKRNNNLYVLNLDSFVWKKLGVTNSVVRPNAQIKGAKRFFNFDDKLLFSYADGPEFFLADLDNNSIEKFKDDVLFYKSGGHSIVKKNNLIGAVQNSVTGDLTIESFNISFFLSNKTNNKVYLYRDTEEFYRYVYFALSFLVILIIILKIYYSKVAQTYLLDEKTISLSGSSVKLSELEQKTLRLFCENRSVSNSKIMALFLNKDKTKDFAVKRKNKTLLALNDKLYSEFRVFFIDKQKSKSDSRQLTYFLNKKLRILEILST